MKGTGMRAILCIESCEPFTIGPFGVFEYYGSGLIAQKGKIYYANTCSSREHYYVASENYGLGNSAHTHTSFMGLYEAKYFEEEFIENHLDSTN